MGNLLLKSNQMATTTTTTKKTQTNLKGTAMKEAPTAAQLTPKMSKGDKKLECSNSGYTKMTRELLALVLFLVTFAKETFAAMLPVNLQYSLNYFYGWLLGVGDWIGYAISALYYFSLEYDFGD